MSTLQEYLSDRNSLESCINEAAYNKFTEDPEEALRIICNLYISKTNNDPSRLPQSIKNLVYGLYSIYNNNTPKARIFIPLVFSPTSEVIKINRQYDKNSELRDLTYDLIKKNGGDVDSNVIVIDGYRFKWGLGGLTRADKSTAVKTDIQENISCNIFNTFWPKNILTIDDSTDGLTDLMISPDGSTDYSAYNDWKTSWIQQYNTLAASLDKEGWTHKNIVAERWSDVHQKNTVVGAIANAVAKIQKRRGNTTSKDAITPADIFIYNKNKEDEIIDSIREAIDVDRTESDLDPQGTGIFLSLKKFFNEARSKKLLIGVSLKKGSAFDAKYLNYEPCTDFQDLTIVKINYDPIKWICTKSNLQDEAREAIASGKVDYKDYEKWKPSKSLCITVKDNDTNSIIDVAFRTNNAGERQSLILEPKYKSGNANIGKCPVFKWHAAISKYVKEFDTIKDPKSYKGKEYPYDIKWIRDAFEEISKPLNNITKIETTADDIENIFKSMMPIEPRCKDSVLWAIYIELFFLKAMLTQDDPTSFIRPLLLAAEKQDDDCLPYLLLNPQL